MAFPTTALIDTFTHADASPLPTSTSGVTWADFTGFYAAGGLKIVSNQCQTTTAGGRRGEYISTSTYGPDSEAYVSCASSSGMADGETFDLWVRIAAPTGTTTGYFLRYAFQSAAADNWTLFRRDSAANVQISTANQDIVFGTDKIGVEIIGSTITAYRFNGTSWSSVTSGTDSTYTAAGNIALAVQDGIVDDFGGGTVVGGGGPATSSIPVFTLQPSRHPDRRRPGNR